MTTSFTITAGTTVPSNYSWDYGIPFSTNSSLLTAAATRTTKLITGYAPGLSVVFSNTSTDDTDYQYTEYAWNFGDYYNTDNNNLSLSCIKNVSHVFVMPGTYTVTLNHTQAKNSSFLYGTVNSTLSGYDKYCKFWNWYDLRGAGDNPIAWENTKTNTTYAKKWVPEASTGICQTNKLNLSSLNIAVVQSQTTESATVQVLEINPKASMYSVTRPVTGYSPLSLQITPRTTTPGSFPIDRLDWDFGNGLPIKTVTRYSSPDTTFFTFTCAISNDITDPRNYDALCTYSRKLNTYPVFYPSITAYSSSTGSYDTCSLTVGPVSLSSISGQAHLLKVRNSPYGKLYGIQAQNYVTFVTTQTANSDNNIILTTPPNVIKNSFGTTMRYFGNKGTGYPPISAIVC